MPDSRLSTEGFQLSVSKVDRLRSRLWPQTGGAGGMSTSM